MVYEECVYDGALDCFNCVVVELNESKGLWLLS